MEQPAIIRAMATTLLDSDTDLCDNVAIITRLVTAGWPTKEIEENYTAATTMALVRKMNDGK